MNFSRRITGFLIVLCVLFFAACPASAEGTEVKTVRAAVIGNSIYAYQDEDGVWRGIDVECLKNVAQRAGLRMEFIDSANDPDFMENLGNGTYDIVCNIVKTPEREAAYLFCDTELGTINNTLAVRADDDRWDYGNIEQVSRMKVGVLATYANNADFRKWCAGRRVTPEITEYQSIDEMTAALSAGEIDAEVYSASYGEDYTKTFSTVLQFLPEAYYYAFRSDDVDLKNKVDSALAEIISENPDYLVNLKKKYGYQFGLSELPLSSSEKSYIAEKKTASVAVLENDAPYYYKAADGENKGIVPDYFTLLSRYSGLEFSYRIYATEEDAVNAVKSGEADVLGVFSGGLIAAGQSGLAVTSDYSTVNNVLIMKSGMNVESVNTAAVQKRSADALESSGSGSIAQAQMTGYETAGKCFDALMSGQADAAVLGLPSATWLLNQTNATAYSISPLPGMTMELCGAVAEDSRTLYAVLNKSITATRDSFDGIVTNDTLPQNTWQSFIARIPATVTVTVALVLIGLILVLAWALAMLRRRQRERAEVLAAQAEIRVQKLQAEAMEKGAEERNMFFANISHDMRTPLNAVIGFIRLARRENITPEQRKDYLDKAESSSALLLNLIDDTLTVSKASSGKMELHPAPCRTADLAEAVVSSVRSAAEKKNITFTADLSGMKDRVILADSLSIQKIFLNLLSNAVKYTPAGGHIWYTVAEEPHSGPQIGCVMTVRDDGIGVSAEFLPHIFEAFAQERRKGYESVGTGLGLSIVKQLVDLMGGEISVVSEKGRGTAFTVRLHFEEAADADAQKTVQSVPESGLRGKKVLLCEDNALNREIAAALLNERGMTADMAENGEDGVRMFLKSAPGEYAAVLMDVRMPVLDGIAAAERIRAAEHPDAKDIPIIAMTADAFAEDVQRCLKAGMNGHIAKPVDPEAMYRAIAEGIARRG